MTERKDASLGRNGCRKGAKTDRNILSMHQFLVSLTVLRLVVSVQFDIRGG